MINAIAFVLVTLGALAVASTLIFIFGVAIWEYALDIIHNWMEAEHHGNKP